MKAAAAVWLAAIGLVIFQATTLLVATWNLTLGREMPGEYAFTVILGGLAGTVLILAGAGALARALRGRDGTSGA